MLAERACDQALRVRSASVGISVLSVVASITYISFPYFTSQFRPGYVNTRF